VLTGSLDGFGIAVAACSTTGPPFIVGDDVETVLPSTGDVVPASLMSGMD
jgi:hypothetical protein